MSRFGITIDSFLDITPREFFLALEYDARKAESSYKIICETIRTATLHLYNTQGIKKKDQKSKPIQLMKFPWDEMDHKSRGKKEKGNYQTKKQMVSVMKSLAGIKPKKKKKDAN